MSLKYEPASELFEKFGLEKGTYSLHPAP